ncbi:MAG: hypothetical protein ACRDRA_08485 [Pseudonocardiaceae bacterium]
MSKHEKQDPKDKYDKNGHEPGVYPFKNPGGKHEKPDTDEKDKDDKDKKK